MTDLLFSAFHRYNKLVNRGLVEPLTHSCGTEYVTGFGPEDELMLQCYTCNSAVAPGKDTIVRVFMVVKEYFHD